MANTPNDLNIRQLNRHFPHGSVILSGGEIILNVTKLLGKRRNEITADSPIGTDLLLKLLESFYLAQAEFNSGSTARRMQTINFRVQSPRVVDRAINAQITYEVTVNASLMTDSPSAIIQ